MSSVPGALSPGLPGLPGLSGAPCRSQKKDPMDSPVRFQRLVDLIAQSRALSAKTPVPCLLLQVLDSLSEEETVELGTYHLNKDRHGCILNRLGQALSIEPCVVFRVLAHSLAWDLEDYAPAYEVARRAFEESGLSEAEAATKLEHQPPQSVAFIYRAQRYHWSAAEESRNAGARLGRMAGRR